MRKSVKILLFSALALYVGQIFAAAISGGMVSSAPAVNSMNGFYAGGGVGMGNPDSIFQLKRYSSAGALTNYYQADFGKHNGNLKLFLGYGRVIASNVYLGAELFGRYIFANQENDLTQKTYSGGSLTGKVIMNLKNTYSFGANVRLGYLVLPRVMAYVLFGSEYSNFELKNVSTETSNFQFSKHSYSYMPGIGMEASITDNFAVRMQYIYSHFKSFKKTLPDSSGKMELKFSPVYNNFSLDFIYRIPV